MLHSHDTFFLHVIYGARAVGVGACVLFLGHAPLERAHEWLDACEHVPLVRAHECLFRVHAIGKGACICPLWAAESCRVHALSCYGACIIF